MSSSVLYGELYPQSNWIVQNGDKVPLRAIDKKRASVTNPADWCDYTTAETMVRANSGYGLGFVLSNSSGYTVVDLDTHRTTDPQVKAIHQEVYNNLNTYAEFSPSGGGMHLWLRGSIPHSFNRRDLCLEAYSTERYMTVTFNTYRNIPLLNDPDLLNSFAQYFAPPEKPAANGVVDSPQIITDEVLLDRAANAVNGELFKWLWAGNWQGKYPSQSEADQALANILAFYTDNKEQVERLFQASGLGKRKKATRKSYLYGKYGIIDKAFDKKVPQLNLDALLTDAIAKRKVELEVAEQAVAVEPPSLWVKPPGLLGDVAEFIYLNAFNQSLPVAVASAIAFMAGITGRACNVSKAGLNVYLALLAPTGYGKESGKQGIDRLFAEVHEQAPKVDDFKGPGLIKSASGLHTMLAKSPCFVSQLDEIGLLLQRMNNKHAGQNDIDLQAALLSLYSKSGYPNMYDASAYADAKKNVAAIESPAFTLIGYGTPDSFYRAIAEELASAGLVSRFIVIQVDESEPPPFNERGNAAVADPAMVFKLGLLARQCIELNRLGKAHQVPLTNDALELARAFQKECLAFTHNTDESATSREFWNRSYLSMLKLAALSAVVEDVAHMVIGVDNVEWAKSVIMHSNGVIRKRAESGQMGKESLALEQKIVLDRCIKKFCSIGWTKTMEINSSVTKPMYDARIITYRYIHQQISKMKAFRNDHNPNNALRFGLYNLCASGVLEPRKTIEFTNGQSKGDCYVVCTIQGL